MFWQEDEDKTLPWQAPDDVLDVSFVIRCKGLAQDHAWDLAKAIGTALPWYDHDPISCIHPIHVAESANGWMRPDNADDQLIIPSKRTRMSLRIPKARVADALTLTGKTLDIGIHPLTVGAGKEKPLTNASVIFSRYVLSADEESEEQFLQRMADEIRQLTQANVKKMLCGKSHYVRTDSTTLLTRHLMIADLDSEPSLSIQQQGLGEGRKFGCGVFLPHKGIKTLKPTE